MLRTTTAITVVNAGTKYNVFPYSVKCYVNHRVHPNDTIESVVEYDRKIINDPRIDFRIADQVTHPSPISSFKNQPFNWIKGAVDRVYGNPTTNSVMVGNTDTKHYWDLSKSIYRFSPVELDIKDVAMFHGLNERISVDGLSNMMIYYKDLILQANE